MVKYKRTARPSPCIHHCIDDRWGTEAEVIRPSPYPKEDKSRKDEMEIIKGLSGKALRQNCKARWRNYHRDNFFFP